MAMCIHIIDHRSPRQQIGRHLVDQFLPMRRVGSLVRVVADETAVAIDSSQ